MAMYILRPILKNIKESSYYGIMANETTDIINKERFVICIRWADNGLNANEDFLGLHELSVTNRNFDIYLERCCITIRTRPRPPSSTMF